MSYSDAPTSVRSLEQRIRNLEGSEQLALRRRVGMALVVVGQMLPEGAIKGGSAMALRYGRGTRFTQDLDAARVQPLARFRSGFEDALRVGWWTMSTPRSIGSTASSIESRKRRALVGSFPSGWAPCATEVRMRCACAIVVRSRGTAPKKGRPQW